MSCTRDHSGFEHGPDPHGRPVDDTLLGQFVGAAFDGCQCQAALLNSVAEDAPTVARLVEVVCGITHEVMGGLPRNMIDEDEQGPVSAEFRRLARAGADDADLTHAAMFALCAQMSSYERRAAADTATDLLIGHLAFGQEVELPQSDNTPGSGDVFLFPGEGP